MEANDWLLLQAGVVLGMMILLGLVKRRSNKQGLQRFVRRHSKRQKYVKAALYERENLAASDDKESDKQQD